MRAVKRSEPRRGNQQQAATAGSVRVRRKVDPASPPTTCDIKGVRVHFPFSPYNVQIAYMSKVMDALLQSENALLESPTGTGKTFCLLCACLAWQQAQKHELHKHELHMAAELVSQQQQQQQQQHNSQAHPPPTLPHPLPHPPPTTPAAAASLPVIIYASRTHSQLSQVVRELRHTRYRPTHAVLASREQMCVNPKVKKAASSAADINHDCNKLGKERKCRYRNGLEGFVPPANESQSAGNDTQPVMDLEELVAMGTTSKVCPFYYTRGQVEKAELILVPYNYLFDKDARETTLADVRWANAVVIFDEAHNLESFASDSASFDLSNADIAGCMNEVQRGVNYMHSMPDLNYDLKEDNLVLLLRAFEGLEHHIMDLGGKTAFGGEFMMEIFRKGAGITFANHLLFMEELRKVNDMIMDLRGTGATRGSPRLEHFVSCLKRVYGHQEEGRCLAKASSYRVVRTT
jgi:regulator of telomere elongation helicase 1